MEARLLLRLLLSYIAPFKRLRSRFKKVDPQMTIKRDIVPNKTPHDAQKGFEMINSFVIHRIYPQTVQIKLGTSYAKIHCG